MPTDTTRQTPKSFLSRPTPHSFSTKQARYQHSANKASKRTYACGLPLETLVAACGVRAVTSSI
jgi:hypothetical protein